MPEAGSKNGSTPDPWEGVRKLGQEVLGGLQKTFAAMTTSTSSSTPTPRASESPEPSFNESIPMPPATVEPDASSSTSPPSESVWSVTSNPFRERERENTLVLHFVSFGTEEQSVKAAETLLWDLGIKGHNVLSATLNGDVVELPTKKP